MVIHPLPIEIFTNDSYYSYWNPDGVMTPISRLRTGWYHETYTWEYFGVTLW